MILWNSNFGESPSGKAPDFDSGIRRFDPYLPSQFSTYIRVEASPPLPVRLRGPRATLWDATPV